MRSIFQKTRIVQLIEQRNGYMVLACGLTVLCLLLVILSFYLSDRERIIITPPLVEHGFWVTNSEVSSQYLADMTTFFMYLRLNVTPESADNQRQSLLRYVYPSDYGAFNTLLISERDRIIAQHISSAFYPVNMQIDAKALSVMITGDLISSVGTTQLSPQRVAYFVKYHYSNGRLLVEQFQEVKPHDN